MGAWQLDVPAGSNCIQHRQSLVVRYCCSSTCSPPLTAHMPPRPPSSSPNASLKPTLSSPSSPSHSHVRLAGPSPASASLNHTLVGPALSPAPALSPSSSPSPHSSPEQEQDRAEALLDMAIALVDSALDILYRHIRTDAQLRQDSVLLPGGSVGKHLRHVSGAGTHLGGNVHELREGNGARHWVEFETKIEPESESEIGLTRWTGWIAEMEGCLILRRHWIRRRLQRLTPASRLLRPITHSYSLSSPRRRPHPPDRWRSTTTRSSPPLVIPSRDPSPYAQRQ